MSEVKRLSLDMQFAKSQVKHDDNGELCFYRDYAALQQKLDALSRECGMMSGLLNDISRYHEECTHDDQMHALIPLEYVSAINGFVERDVDGENPCPLTDAFLSAVRAEGVDLYAQALRRQQEDAVTQSEHRHTRLGRAAVFAEEFANKLRAGHTEGPTHD